MRQTAVDGCLMFVTLDKSNHVGDTHRAAQIRPPVENHVFGVEVRQERARARIRPRWMQSDEVINCKPIFYQADALLKR